MSEKLTFGDPKIIIDMARKIPHIIEDEHNCDCMYCNRYDVEWYVCSECWNGEDELKDFKYPTWYKCPRCDVELMTPREYSDYVWAKERQYEPLLPKKYLTWE